MTRAYTWEELRKLSLARQFPRARGRGVAQVVETLRRAGPIQAQTARSPFLALAARLPGVSHETVTAAYESARIVRGSSIRGTVHTSTPEHHRLLDVATREGQRQAWKRTLKVQRQEIDEVRAVVETLAVGDWRTPNELRALLDPWLRGHDSDVAADQLTHQTGKNFPIAHSALVRRPLTGGWDQQGQVGYRLASEVVGGDDADERARWVADPATALAALARVHLAAYGPATRRDVAWWSGLGLRAVDAALERLRAEATVRPGPEGGEYWDLADGMPRGAADVGTRLLPEFDAVLVGYDPKARDRFVAPEHVAVLWTQANGLSRPPVLHEGRVVGLWRAEGGGTARRLTVTCFAGSPRPEEADLTGPVAALEAAMSWTVTDLAIAADTD